MFLLYLAPSGIADFQFRFAIGARTMFSLLLHYPGMSAVHTSGATFRQAIGIVVYAVAESPFLLPFGYWTQFLALCEYRLFKYVPRFHNQKLNKLGWTWFSCLAVGFLCRSCILRSSACVYCSTALLLASAFSSSVSSTMWFTQTWQEMGLPTSMSSSS